MQARALDNNADQILQHVRAIAAAGTDDGLIFDADEATATVIRDESNNTGVLVSLTANLAAARLSCMWT